MKLLKVNLIVMALLVYSGIASAQKITNADANQEGKTIAVTYDLDEKADITLYITQDGGKTKTAIPHMYTSGDVGKKVKPGKNKKILWRVLDQYPNQNYQAENVSFIIKGKPSMRFFTMLNAGYSLDSGFNTGLTLGQLGLIGWYVKGMSTIAKPMSADFECDENGYIDGTLPAYSGMASKFKAYGIAGLTLRLGAPVYINAGVGYGVRDYEWETMDGKWVKNLPGSYSGLAIDAGIITRMNHLVFSAGATILGGNVDICAGIGFVF